MWFFVQITGLIYSNKCNLFAILTFTKKLFNSSSIAPALIIWCDYECLSYDRSQFVDWIYREVFISKSKLLVWIARPGVGCPDFAEC